jgi:hypothetical protein
VYIPVGVAKANEMLIWGKKKEAQELLDCGFIKYACFLLYFSLVLIWVLL